MNSFFVSKEIYKDRLETCRSCKHYFKPTGSCKLCGCFMRIKSSLSISECADNPKKWLATKEYEAPKEIPTHLKNEIKEVYKLIDKGKIKDIQSKQRLIELYNTIHNTNYNTSTNCSSCLNTIYKFMQDIITKI